MGSRAAVITAPPHFPGWAVQPPYTAAAYATETIDGVSVTRGPLLMKRHGGGVWRLIAPWSFGVSALPAVLWRALHLRPDVILCVVPTLFATPAALLHRGGDGEGFRTRHGVPPDAFVAMYAGHIGAKQAIEVLLEAAKLCRREPAMRFVIAGDGPLKAPLMAAYADLRNVLWLPLQPEHELCAMLNAADVHVVPQLRRAANLVLPSKLGGMLACGKPLIVAADPGTELAEVLEGAAMLVPPGDPEAMADALFDALDQQDADTSLEARLGIVTALERQGSLRQFYRLLTGGTGRSAAAIPAIDGKVPAE